MLKLDPTNTELLAQKQQLLAQRVEQSTKKLDALKDAQKNMDKNGIDKNSAQYMALQREIIETEGAVKSDRKEIDKLTDAEKKNTKSAKDTGDAHEKFQKVLKGVGIAAAAATAATIAAGKAIWDMAKNTATAGDEIDKESQKLQISAELYQKLGYAARLSGTDIEVMKKGVTTITTELNNMANGAAGAGEKFESIGVSLTNANGDIKSTEEVLLETIEQLASMEDETARNAAANEIFGRSYSELLPLLNTGADGIRNMMQEAEDYGVVMGDDAVKASADFSDALEKLKGTFEGLKNGAMGELLPMLTDVVNGLAAVLAGDMSGTSQIEKGITDLLSKLQEKIPEIVSFVSDIALAVVQAAPQIMDSLAGGLLETLPDIFPSILDIVLGIADMLIENAPELVSAALQMIVSLATGLTEHLDELIPAAIDMVIGVVDAIIDNVDLLIDAAIELIVQLALGLIENIPKLVEKIPDLIEALVVAIIEHTPELIVASIQILIALARGLIQSVGILVKKAPELISAIGEAIANAAKQLWEIGKNIVLGLWEGIKNAWHTITDWVQNAIQGLVGGIKDFLGIASPSKVFMQIGDYMAEGLGIGFVKEMDKVADQMEDAIPGINTTFTSNIVTSSASHAESLARTNAMQSVAAGMVNGLSASAGGGTYTFNLVLPSGEVLARYQLPALIDVARASGTPILNPGVV